MEAENESFVSITQTLGYVYSYKFPSRLWEVLVKGCASIIDRMTDFSVCIECADLWFLVFFITEWFLQLWVCVHIQRKKKKKKLGHDKSIKFSSKAIGIHFIFWRLHFFCNIKITIWARIKYKHVNIKIVK